MPIHLYTMTLLELGNKGPGVDPTGRSPLAKQLTPDVVKPYITLSMIEGSKWLINYHVFLYDLKSGHTPHILVDGELGKKKFKLNIGILKLFICDVFLFFLRR